MPANKTGQTERQFPISIARHNKTNTLHTHTQNIRVQIETKTHKIKREGKRRKVQRSEAKPPKKQSHSSDAKKQSHSSTAYFFFAVIVNRKKKKGRILPPSANQKNNCRANMVKSVQTKGFLFFNGVRARVLHRDRDRGRHRGAHASWPPHRHTSVASSSAAASSPTSTCSLPYTPQRPLKRQHPHCFGCCSRR